MQQPPPLPSPPTTRSRPAANGDETSNTSAIVATEASESPQEKQQQHERQSPDERQSPAEQEREHEREREHEHSPESAGLARGIARSAARQGASRAAVGRLPLPRSSNVPNAKPSPGLAAARATQRIRRVARVSDRAATGFDVVAEASEANATSNATSNTATATATTTTANANSNSNPTSVASRLRIFAGGLAKNTILGAAVFSTYEGLLDWNEPRTEHNGSGGTVSAASGTEQPSLPPPSLAWHYGAGFCAGSAHAFLGSAIEGFVTATRLLRTSLFSASSSSAAAASASSALFSASSSSSFVSPSFLPRFLHHSVSHAVLFGSYETLKRGLMRTLPLTTATTTTTTTADDDENETENDNYDFEQCLAAVALAGGGAGIAQQLVGDRTEGFARAVAAAAAEPGASSINWRVEMARAVRPGVSLRTLVMASVPTAIGFVAFEYGREAVLGVGGGEEEDDDDGED